MLFEDQTRASKARNAQGEQGDVDRQHERGGDHARNSKFVPAMVRSIHSSAEGGSARVAPFPQAKCSSRTPVCSRMAAARVATS